ncbi:MAG: GDSL-type esterase/lipase family protein [Planctomycetota bacterium]
MSARLLLAFPLALALCPALAPAQTRVACLGDSITFGAQLEDREREAWPVRLGVLLGEGFDVRNFGVGGRTLLRKADTPLVRTDAWRAALDFAPDVAVIALGTNDTYQDERRHNWDHEADLEADAAFMVDALRARNASVRVLLASPTGMFFDKEGLSAARRANLVERATRLSRIEEALRAVASAREGVEYLEMKRALRAEHVGDGVHTTALGALRIARRVAEAIRAPRVGALGLAAALGERGVAVTEGAFHEFRALEFRLPETGAACRVVLPFGAVAEAPWVWRARFFGHQPALDLALLERGFHLVYCDVADLYGGPEAMRRFDECYELVRASGLGARPVLEGMSRGGLVIVNWAARHPQRVSALYGDNPVVDFRSWPGGQSGKRSDPDWLRCLAAYGLDEAGARAYAQMPVDRLEPLARSQVPLLLVLGTEDEVVPPAENGELMAARYRALGGPVKVWRKPGLGHHPHGLDPVDPLLEEILRVTGMGGESDAADGAPAEETGGVERKGGGR